MNLYQLAQKVSPDSLRDRQSKIIWKNRQEFIYLFREDNVVYLRMSGSEVHLPFYEWDGEKWETTTEELYKMVADIWQDERAGMR